MRSLILCLSLALAGCSTADQRLERVVDRAGTVVDSLNQKAMWQLCEGTTLAGWNRLPQPIRDQIVFLCAVRGDAWAAPELEKQ